MEQTGRDRMRSKYFNNLPLLGRVRRRAPTQIGKRLQAGNLRVNIRRSADVLQWLEHRDTYHVRYFENESKGSRELAKLKSQHF